MPTFNRPEDLKRHLKRAMDSFAAEVIVTAQAELGSAAISPIDTGRLRSSWFAAEGSSSNEVAPEDANSPNNDAQGLRVDSSKTYHLTSNLPYTQSVALEGHVVSKPANWFVDFVNVRIPKIQAAAGKLTKERFEL